MQYIAVEWIHSLPDEPILLYSEIDEDRWERRKIELFRDGSAGFADEEHEDKQTGLSLEPWPSLEEIAADPQFVPKLIGKEVFERLWKAHASKSDS